MKRAALIAAAFGLGLALGYRWCESRYDRLRAQLETLTDVDIDDYLRLKDLEAKYAKADEILGKAILIFFADLKLKVSDDKLQFARSALDKTATLAQSALPQQRKRDPSPPAPEGANAATEPALNVPGPRAPEARDEERPSNPEGPPRGTLRGTVVLGSASPPVAFYNMAADPVCAKAVQNQIQRREDSLVGNGGQIANAFVYLRERPRGPKPPIPDEPVVLRQNACRYEPHVLGIQVGQKLRITNDDPTLHNVHTEARNNPNFNVGQPDKGMVIEKAFNRREIMVKLKCEVHGWMSAYVGVLDHPYFAVTDKEGKFEIKGVPLGEYFVDVWHERFGTRMKRVRVGPDTNLNFTYADR